MASVFGLRVQCPKTPVASYKISSSAGKCRALRGTPPCHVNVGKLSSSFVLQGLRPLQPKLARSGSRAPLATRASAAGVAAGGAGAPAGDGQTSFLSACWKFLRPHTIRGTILGTTAVTSRALLENSQAIDWGLLPRALLGLVALLCGNGYIVGINQIYDVEIDKVNKPFLPVAAGELSKTAAWMLCLLLAAGGLGIVARNFDRLITCLYSFGLFLGTIYSVPPMRLKQFPLAAFIIIATVRGFLLNFGVYHATRAALNLPFQWSPSVAFITCFVTLFAVVIAITKDLADIEGDKLYNISTFATRLGPRNVASIGTGLLMLNYVAAVVLAFKVQVSAGRCSRSRYRWVHFWQPLCGLCACVCDDASSRQAHVHGNR
eukprot:jgi/Mesvir1/5972/Mv00726-RA.1